MRWVRAVPPMRIFEVRRHSHRDPLSEHLSEEGVALARRVAPALGPIDRVVSSRKVRAIETVEALGLSPDAIREALTRLPDEVEARVDEAAPRSFPDYLRMVESSDLVGPYAQRLATQWREELDALPDPGHLLAVSHGHLIELGVAAALPAVARSGGRPLAPLEGVRLVDDGERWVRGEILRIVR